MRGRVVLEFDLAHSVVDLPLFLLNTITPIELGAVSEQQTNFAQIRKATSRSL